VNNHAHLITLLFVDFMKQMRASWLPKGWEQQIYNNLSAAQLEENEDSWSWVNE